VSLAWITVFLCWTLYEIGKLIHQANELVSDTREKIGRFERAIAAIGEKLGATSQYLSFIAEGGKQLLSFLHNREEKQERRTAKKKTKEAPLSDMPEETL
jgi:hypothetical protein